MAERTIIMRVPRGVPALELQTLQETLVQTLGQSVPIEVTIQHEDRQDLHLTGIRYLNPVLLAAVSRIEAQGFSVTGPHRAQRNARQ